jgi:hypothetical protein
MNTNYLDLDFKTSEFYQYSKTEQEGYKKHTTDSGKVSYRKTYNKGIYGLLQSVDLKETDFGYKIAVRLLNGDDVFICSVPLHGANKQIDNRFAEPLICLLPNLVKNQAYRIYPYSLEKELDSGKKTFYGISVKLADLDSNTVLDSVAPAFLRRKKDEEVGPGQVPSLVFEKKLTGLKPTLASIGAREDFLEALLEKSVDALGYKANENYQSQQPVQNTTMAPAPEDKPARESKYASKTPVDKVPAAKAPAAQPLDTEDDDLPF